MRTSGKIALAVITLFVICALGGDALAPVDPTVQRFELALMPPFRGSILGTDGYGRDVLSRIIVGARVSLVASFLSVGTAMVFGSILGVVAGYHGGVVDLVVMRIVDAIMCFPAMMVAFVVAAALGPGVQTTVLAICSGLAPTFARVSRAATLQIMQELYIEAAQAAGASVRRVLIRHVAPGLTGVVVVTCTVNLGTAMLIESSLSFLGLGVQPPTPSWGRMVSEGKAYLVTAPWIATFPGLCIALVTVSFNLLGDNLADLLDPKMRSRSFRLRKVQKGGGRRSAVRSETHRPVSTT